ncbi:MAG: TVP38/TMEM64 family protein [Proteobacteria bacterium]|nr:TVP38/TMEM64 family protein [Pseudomonadota bacterium]
MTGKTASRLLLAAVLAIAVALAVAYRDRFEIDELRAWVHSFGILAPAVFVALYAVGTVLFLPGSIITLAGGALFGPVWGSVVNLLGATIGATLAFLAARYLASDWVAKKAGGRLARLIAGVEDEGWRFVALVRLIPLFPFNMLNYALGLTRIRLLHYVVTSLVCMTPAGIAYTYLGHAGREALSGGEDAVQTGLIALGLVAIVAFLPRLVRRLREGGRTEEKSHPPKQN